MRYHRGVVEVSRPQVQFHLQFLQMNHKIIELFDFKNASYDVCFEEYQQSCGFLGLQKRTRKRYYITKRSILYKKKEYLIYNRYLENYMFEELEYILENMEIVYWNNSTEPINLITQAKCLKDSTNKDYAIFSSDDLL